MDTKVQLIQCVHVIVKFYSSFLHFLICLNSLKRIEEIRTTLRRMEGSNEFWPGSHRLFARSFPPKKHLRLFL
jgi:hypothetical protein